MVVTSETRRRADIADRVLRVLHLEDSELDHLLMQRQLARDGLRAHCMRIESREQFVAAMRQDWDVVLSDYNLPGFSGLAALDMLGESGLLVPFILVSGEIGEDTAVAAMRNGASDYLLKSNLTRLVPAMLQAISASESRRARLSADRELAESKRSLSELAQHLQTSIEHERAAIAREIHDDVGGSLTALKFDLAWIVRHATDAQVAERAQQGLETLTQWMTERFEKRTGVSCRLRTSHERMNLPGGVPLVAYRTAQEALTNVSKHAQATRVSVDLTLAGGVLTLEVSDDGRGLSDADLAKTRSFGIRGLHERAGTVGGWVELLSSPRGTELILSIPLGASPGGSANADDEGTDGDTARGFDPTSWGMM